MVDEGYYIGSDLKFQIDITATGFEQASGRYDIDVHCGEMTQHFDQDDVIGHDGKFYLPVSTEFLEPGLLRLVITVYVPDEDFSGGYRREVSVRNMRYVKPVI